MASAVDARPSPSAASGAGSSASAAQHAAAASDRFSLLLLGRLHAHGREQWHSPNMRLLGVVLRRRRQAQKRQSSRPPPQAERIEASRLGRLRCNGAARGAVRARLSARLQHLSGCAIVFASTRASCSGLAVLLRIDLMFFHTNRARY